MKAILARELGDPHVLKVEEVDRARPLSGEVLIRVRTAALNYPDYLMLKGQYQVQPPLPYTPGFELAGTVDELGPGVTGVELGSRVMAQCNIGALAEFAVAPVNSVFPIPDGFSDDQAAAFPLVYQTSYFGLAYRGQLQRGEHVLVHSAAGGVGHAAVQIARAMGAGKIIGTAGSDQKLDVIRQCGADVAVNYRTEDFVEIVKRETGGHGADCVYDPVGGEVCERSTKCIAFEGRLVIIGFTSGAFPALRANHILIKNYSVVGLHWGYYRQMKREAIERGWRELLALIPTGRLRPVIGARYAMHEAAAALEHLASRSAVGKIVLYW